MSDDLLNALFDAPPAELITVVDNQLAVITVRVQGDRVTLERTRLGALPMSLQVVRELLGMETPATKRNSLPVPACEFCGKTFADARGRGGHMRWCKGRAALEVEDEEATDEL